MNANLGLKFNNKYNARLIDSKTGKVKQSTDFTNMVTIGIERFMTIASVNATEYDRNSVYNMLSYLDVGSGSTAPTYEDTELDTFLWQASPASSSYEWVDDYTIRGTATYSFPATSSYVGNVHEVGLRGHTYISGGGNGKTSLCTRALLTDSEGTPISFIKTDTDILELTVTIEISVSSSDPKFTIIKKSQFLLNFVTGSNSSIAGVYGYMNLCRYHADVEKANAAFTNRVNGNSTLDKMVNSSIVAKRKNDAEENVLYIRWPVVRILSTDITEERYYKAFALPGIGYWKLPNEDVFPAYTITGISIGTGDGTTTEFENPLCYFKKDTDKVYKNGAQLTRGTDYIINNVGNKDCLPEVAELNSPVKVTSAAVTSTTLNHMLLFVPSAYQSANAATASEDFAICFSGNSPLYIEYENEVTLNCLKSTGGFRYLQGTNGYGYVPTGTTFSLDYSLDGETYIEVGSYTTTTYNYTTATAFDITFEAVTAKYWRLRTSYTSYPIGISYGAGRYIMLNFKDPYITFAEAPADGDILTMDVDMDIAMKNSNFVIDVGAIIYFEV